MSAAIDFSAIPDQLGTLVIDSDSFGVVSATGDLDAAKLTVVPIIRRLLQGTKSFLDAAVRGQEKLKTINVAFSDYEFVISMANKNKILVVKRPLVASSVQPVAAQ